MSTPPPIQLLPDSVISRLRSSIVLPSLPQAISELIQNALDASATELSATINPTAPSFTLTDNGYGVVPEQISNVGKLYATSKYPPSERYFGSRGEALSALAQHSTLTFTSCAKGWRTSRQVRWSYGKNIFEGIAPDYAALPNSGTVVRVERLWGDMPVRIKAREGLDFEREWADILKAIIGLFLSGRGNGVSIIVRDQDGARQLSINPANRRRGEPWDLMVLRQSLGSEVIGTIQDWENVKARQNGIRIEGWISSKGSASKNIQYIFVNGFPLSMEDTELHREVNRIFENSGFGVIEELDKNGNPKRGAVRRIDKRGMFILRIEFRRGESSIFGGEGGTGGKAGVEGQNLKNLTELLQKLVYEFLKTHHYKPLRVSGGATIDKEIKPSPTLPDIFSKTSRSNSSSRSVSPSITPRSPAAPQGQKRPRMMDISNWSRIKSAKIDKTEESGRQDIFSSKTISGVTPKVVSSTPKITPAPKISKIHYASGTVTQSSRPQTSSSDHHKASLQGLQGLSADLNHKQPQSQSQADGIDEDNEELNGIQDRPDIMGWTNPTSGKCYLVDMKTGNTTLMTSTFAAEKSDATNRNATSIATVGKSDAPRRNFTPPILAQNPSAGGVLTRRTSSLPNLAPFSNLRNNNKPPPSQSDSNQEPSTFIKHLLTNWESPVFPLPEATISSIPLDPPPHSCGSCGSNSIIPPGLSRIGKLTKAGLLSASVIAQVDNKYILCKLPSSHQAPTLVIVDQHAASERVRVEELFKELCEGIGGFETKKKLVYPITSRDYGLMKRFEKYFDIWGISYTLSNPDLKMGSEPTTVTINYLPRVLRDRCEVEPLLAIDILRKYCYELEDNRGPSRRGTWIEMLAKIPKSLVEIVNSRACRGAVMFNDPLSLEECRELVKRLAGCRWPFMCAHGRVSMRPLVELPEVRVKERSGFRSGFNRWKEGGFTGLEDGDGDDDGDN
ncbi:Similar to DNA mismatch repair protein MLH3; acc. no. Q12083 [Pyronema omphalodes CBS 100304]|uniref:Similar to DNA mismatch repair protein MLH3 acc. no. Q12083 n=1 Tax=Pyronema omphalodes (strain CBS 100304) TaxID=1076935 RepID=U4L3W9_PYROM|nr:Similar to DNA mismatch repair protein MLH3; acc. no. Q12083 [Pyronema omphalodes CBS 100304]